METIEVLKKGFQVANNNTRLLLIVFVALLALSPLLVSLQSWMDNLAPTEIDQTLDSPPPPEGGGLPILLLIAFFLLSVFVLGGILGVIRDAVKEQSEATVTKFLIYCRSFMGRLLGYVFIVTAAALPLLLIVGLLILFPGFGIRNFFLALLISGGVVGLVLFYFSPYIIVLDGLKTLESMNRSYRFTREYLWPSLRFLALLFLINLASLIAIGALMLLLRSFLGEGWGYRVVEIIITNAATSYITIVGGVAAMTFYLSRSSSSEEIEIGEQGV